MARKLINLATIPRCKRSLIHTTLLELVWAVSEVTEEDKLVLAAVASVVNSGQVRLTGTFKGARLIIKDGC